MKPLPDTLTFAPKPAIDRTLRGMMVALAFMFVLVGGVGLNRMRLKREVQARIAAIRAQGLPTTLEELDAWYPYPVEGPNAADVYLEALARIGEMDEESSALIQVPSAVRSNLWSRVNALPVDYLDKVESLLENHREPLALIRHAASLPQCRYPTHKQDMGHLSCGSFELRGMGRVLAVAAVVRAERGDLEEAIRYLMDELALSNSLKQMPTTDCAWDRLGLADQAVGHLPRMVSRHEWTDEQLVRMTEAIRGTEEPDMLFRAFAGEQATVLDTMSRGIKFVQRAVTWSEREPSGIQKTAAAVIEVSGLRERNTLVYMDLHQRMLDASRKPFPAPLIAGQMYGEEASALPAHLFLARIFAAGTKPFVTSVASSLAWSRTACAALAAERFRLARGRWPETLDELVPAYLDAVPEDPFDGKPLRYRRRPDGFTVYSIGENGRDDGGDETRVGASMKDIPFTVEKAGAGPAGFRPQTD